MPITNRITEIAKDNLEQLKKELKNVEDKLKWMSKNTKPVKPNDPLSKSAANLRRRIKEAEQKRA